MTTRACHIRIQRAAVARIVQVLELCERDLARGGRRKEELRHDVRNVLTFVKILQEAS